MKQNVSLLEQYNKVKVLMQMLKSYRKNHSTGIEVNTVYAKSGAPASKPASKSNYYTTPAPGVQKMSQKIELTAKNLRQQHGVVVQMNKNKYQ
jgi:hypothetical protein